VCLIEDSEPYDVCSTEDRRARIAHSCTDCGRRIKAGERYRWCRGLYEGRWYTDRSCAHCLQLRTWFDRCCGGSPYGALRHDLDEETGEHDSPQLRRLLAGIRRKWHGWSPEGVLAAVEADQTYRDVVAADTAAAVDR